MQAFERCLRNPEAEAFHLACLLPVECLSWLGQAFWFDYDSYVTIQGQFVQLGFHYKQLCFSLLSAP